MAVRNESALNCFTGIFEDINHVLEHPDQDKQLLPSLNCLEDFAIFTEHMIGTDGKENMSAPLVSHVKNLEGKASS